MGRVIVTGPPGCGKTTLAVRVAELLRESGEPVAGFTTREIRRGGRRTGFTVTGMGGRERRLAVINGTGPRVGRYAVDVGAFEEVALTELEAGLDLGATLVVDEVGRMELLSESFRKLLPAVFEADRVLATVHARPDPVTDELKRRPGITVLHLDAPGREALTAEALRLLTS